MNNEGEYNFSAKKNENNGGDDDVPTKFFIKLYFRGTSYST